jgi:hypothetical protein
VLQLPLDANYVSLVIKRSFQTSFTGNASNGDSFLPTNINCWVPKTYEVKVFKEMVIPDIKVTLPCKCSRFLENDYYLSGSR